MFLTNSIIFRSNNVLETEKFIEKTSLASLQKARPLRKSGDVFCCSRVSTENFHMFYVESYLSATLKLYPVNYIRLMFQIDGISKVQIEEHEIISSSKLGGYVIPEGAFVRDSHEKGFKSLTLRVDPDALRKKLEELTGKKIEGKVQFQQPTKLDSKVIAFLRQAVFNTACEIDTIDPRFHACILHDLNGIVLTRLLLHAPHNYSHMLDKRTLYSDPAKIQKIEDYIHENPNTSLTIKRLSLYSGLSERTILRYFKKMHGTTPHDYIRRVRLDYARRKLNENSDGSVLAIALASGFKSFGHFAEVYEARYGELPSVTLQRARD